VVEDLCLEWVFVSGETGACEPEWRISMKLVSGEALGGSSLKTLDNGPRKRSLLDPFEAQASGGLYFELQPDMHHTLSLFIAQAAPTAAPQAPSAFGTLVPMICIFAIMYFLMIRPQQQKQKQLQDRISNLKTGDEVVVAGIHGVVANLKDGDTLTLKIADNVRIEVDKSAIATVVARPNA